MKSIIRNVIVFATILVVMGGAPHAFALRDLSLGLVPCGQAGPLLSNGQQACGFNQLIELLSNILDFLIFVVAPIILIITLLVGGIQLVFSGGSGEALNEAKSKLGKAVVGMIIAMCAWLIVKFILITLNVDLEIFPAFWS